MKNLKVAIQINFVQAMEILMAIVGHPFTAWTLFTEQTLVGGKSAYAVFGGKVYKLAKYVLVVKRDYNRAIELACDKAGIDFSDWKPQPHPYATNIGGNLLTHNNDLNMAMDSNDRRNYAQFMLHKDCQIEVQYFDAELRPLTYEQVAPYLGNKVSKKQTDLGLSKDEQIKVINPSIKSIQSFSANGNIYEIVAD